MSKKLINVADYPVMKAKCATCPFRTDADGKHSSPDTVSRIQRKVLTKASQICHHPRFSGKPENYLCRGARDYQLTIFYRLGIIPAPTDEAWNEVLRILKDADHLKNPA